MPGKRPPSVATPRGDQDAASDTGRSRLHSGQHHPEQRADHQALAEPRHDQARRKRQDRKVRPSRAHRGRHGRQPDSPRGRARLMVQVRVGYSDHLGEPAWKCLLKRLTNASSEFTEPWERQEVRPPESISKHILNAHVGLLRLTNTSLWLSPALGTRMVTLSPADAATTAALHELGSLALAAA